MMMMCILDATGIKLNNDDTLGKSAAPQHFHEFFTQNFLTIFLVKSKLSTNKGSKPQHFHKFFTKKQSTIFSENKS